MLVENEELQLSEWFKFRCNIDSTGALSSDVPSYLESAKSVSEIHSYTGTACTMPEAISYLAQAIQAVTSELLNLKCKLTIGDYVIIASLEETDKFVIPDKAEFCTLTNKTIKYRFVRGSWSVCGMPK